MIDFDRPLSAKKAVIEQRKMVREIQQQMQDSMAAFYHLCAVEFIKKHRWLDMAHPVRKPITNKPNA